MLMGNTVHMVGMTLKQDVWIYLEIAATLYVLSGNLQHLFLT